MLSSESIQPPQHFGVCPYFSASLYQPWVWIVAAFYEDLSTKLLK
jgi:hypothetical protein